MPGENTLVLEGTVAATLEEEVGEGVREAVCEARGAGRAKPFSSSSLCFFASVLILMVQNWPSGVGAESSKEKGGPDGASGCPRP